MNAQRSRKCRSSSLAYSVFLGRVARAAVARRVLFVNNHRNIFQRNTSEYSTSSRKLPTSILYRDRDSIMPPAAEADSRSPSPTAAPPIADTPGPRAQGLINVFNQASKATLDKCSSKNFASCFPTAAQYSPEVLENLRGQIVDQLDRTWKTNFDDIMERRNVVKLLNSLDQAIDDAKARKKRAEADANGGPVEAPIP